jgi:large-conductance mechanosensitive channel
LLCAKQWMKFENIVKRQLKNALNIWNDSFSILIHNLSLNFNVFVYYEKNDNQSKSWKDSFKLLNVNDKSTIIEFSSDSIKFRLTMIKSYHDDNYFENSSFFISIVNFSFIAFFIAFTSKSSNMSQSKNQFAVSNDQKWESEIFSNLFKRDRDQLRKYFALTAFLSFVYAIVDFVFASISLFVLAVVFKLDSVVHIAFP